MTPLQRHHMFWRTQFQPRLNQEKQDKDDENTVLEYQSTSSTVRKQGGIVSFDWTSLNPILIKDMRLFVTHQGHYLEAKIIGRPFLETGMATVLEDTTGEQMVAAFYNCAGADIMHQLKMSSIVLS